MAQLRVYVFGPPRLERNNEWIDLGLRRAQALLVYRAVTRQPQSRDTLATLLWPDSDQREARANLRRTLHRLTYKIPLVYYGRAAEIGIEPAVRQLSDRDAARKAGVAFFAIEMEALIEVARRICSRRISWRQGTEKLYS
ncbi:MAG: hypothetical protein HC828_12155 [Blastochloris sp.]|nr:hypothetical protein [Blastochloris sp.]